MTSVINHYLPDKEPVRYDIAYYISDKEPVRYDIAQKRKEETCVSSYAYMFIPSLF
jgi:hypothetical protein